MPKIEQEFKILAASGEIIKRAERLFNKKT
jgi:hypothetical protein